MIPILYPAVETEFTSFGIGTLPDAISCIVVEERNGECELTMAYPLQQTKPAVGFIRSPSQHRLEIVWQARTDPSWTLMAESMSGIDGPSASWPRAAATME